MGTTPDQVRAEIEQTRAELTGDVDRLVERTSPRKIAERRTERLRSAVRGTKERVMGIPSEGSQKVQGAADSARAGAHQAADTARAGAHQAAQGAQQAADVVRSAPEMAVRQTQGNPLAAGLIAFGGGLLVASLLPTSSAERQAGHQIREQAGDLAEPVKGVAQGVFEDSKSTFRESAEHVKEAATSAAQTTGEEAKGQAQQVRQDTGH